MKEIYHKDKHFNSLKCIPEKDEFEKTNLISPSSNRIELNNKFRYAVSIDNLLSSKTEAI